MQLQATIQIDDSALPILHPEDRGSVGVIVSESTLVDMISYDPQKRTLDVYFTTGSAYRYSRVPFAEAFTFVGARSKGEYFNRNIRGKYTTQRLG